MFRTSIAQFKNWQSSKRRKPLIVRGARQIGKTWTIEHFGKEQFDDYLKIDLEKRADLHQVFAGDLSPQKLIAELELAFGHYIEPGKTLLFFDEIQTCPRALMSLRYFYEEMPELHVIAAGSLLEFALSEIPFPVGRVQFLNMYPMNFYEFLIAAGHKTLAKKITAEPEELSDLVHDKLINLVHHYCFVGGFPEAVLAYTERMSMNDSFTVHDEILESYRQDFAKYAQRADKTCLNMILEKASQLTGEQSIYSKLADGFSNPTIKRSFELLCMAKLLNKHSSTQAQIPLGAGVNLKKFKTSLVDVGLMHKLSKLNAYNEMQHKDLLDMFRGKLAEQFVAQELRCAQDETELFYWTRDARNSNAEVDYLIQMHNEIYPIEVKSGKGGSLRSLHLMLKENPQCPQGIVLYSGKYKKLTEQRLTFLPIYYTGQLSTEPSNQEFSDS